MTRAQEAEENYVIKRELAVVRQQCSSAAEDLQKAQSTIRQLQEQQVLRGDPSTAPPPQHPPSQPSGSACYFLVGRVGDGESQKECSSPSAQLHSQIGEICGFPVPPASGVPGPPH